MPQYTALLSHLPTLESALISRGESVGRPTYTKGDDQEEQVADTDGAGDDRKRDSDNEKEDRDGEDKKNFEATSESES